MFAVVFKAPQLFAEVNNIINDRYREVSRSFSYKYPAILQETLKNTSKESYVERRIYVDKNKTELRRKEVLCRQGYV